MKCAGKHYLGPEGPSDILMLHLVGPGAVCARAAGGYAVQTPRLPQLAPTRPTMRQALEAALEVLDAAGSRLPCDPRPAVGVL